MILAIMLRRNGSPASTRPSCGAWWGPPHHDPAAVVRPHPRTIQFGVFAGFGTALAALACVAVEQAARRTVRNFSLFAAALLVVCAIVAAGRNAWPWPWYFGIPWYDKGARAGRQADLHRHPRAGRRRLLIALWQHLRIDYVDDAGLGHDKVPSPPGGRSRSRRRRSR